MLRGIFEIGCGDSWGGCCGSWGGSCDSWGGSCGAFAGFDCLAARAAAAFWTFALFGKGFNLLGSIDSNLGFASSGTYPKAHPYIL
mmetsp:Transcript_55923/g.131138  ORF Transcript_55923/g.131138 Transcript_55923/m.131138 type:complete len:86 (-) Transcript_55923:33-290(-)